MIFEIWLHIVKFFSHKQCSENDLVDKTLSQLFGMSGKQRLGLIEAGCTDRRESLARTHLVNHFNISQVGDTYYAIIE